MEIVSIIISILALMASVYTYFVHDRKIKQQEARINEYQLEKIKNEEEENKKALICGNIVKGRDGLRILKIYNKGKATARNIDIQSSEPSIIRREYNNDLPCELIQPQDFMEIRFYAGHMPETKVKITFTWDDDFKSENERTQILPL